MEYPANITLGRTCAWGFSFSEQESLFPFAGYSGIHCSFFLGEVLNG